MGGKGNPKPWLGWSRGELGPGGSSPRGAGVLGRCSGPPEPRVGQTGLRAPLSALLQPHPG